MSLTSGHRLGPYEILTPLGAGGMGEVYRARDSRLDRDVAIKVLPADRVADTARRWAFVQEAKAASALNHPHIVTIHEIESVDGLDFIVMEYVPGRTLDALIPKNGMPVRELLRVAIPMADALAAAHEHGVVHCDLKPANVIVSSKGVVKVLDFGVAKLVGHNVDAEATGTVTVPLQPVGATAGTPPYMSPEQLSGGTVDARSDVFSFGTVLYEMATGHRAFRRQSVSETAAAIVHDEPAAPRQLTPALPDDLERIILRCLKKDPARRFQHASDLKVELEELRDEPQAKGTSNAPRARRRHLVLGAIVLAVVGIAATVTLWALRPAAFPEATLVHLTSERSTEGGSFSPDGTQVAYASAGDDGINWDIRLKVVGEVESRRLTTDPAAEGYPSWSRDGTQIAFLRYNSGTTRGLTHLAVGTVHVTSPVGGSERQVSTFPARLQLSWSPDGRWLAVSKGRSPSGPPGGIYLLSIASGEARAITFPTAPAFDVSPAFSPEGHDLAYASCEGAEVTPACEVRVVALDTGYRPRGPTRALPSTRRGWIGVAWTRDGRSIVYGAGDLSRIRANGTAPPEPLKLMANAWWPSIALGRPRLAFMQRVGDADLYHLEEGRPPEPIVGSNVNDIQPQYSPDGRRIAFVSAGAGETKREIWLADADGSNLVRLTRGPGLSQGWPGWSPDGRSIVFDSRDPNGHVDIWLIDASGSGLRQLTNDSGDEVLPSFSRDGRFVYFTSKRTGRDEVWRVPSAGGTQEQVSRDGGVFPFESWDGRTVYYLRAVGDAPLVGRSVEGGEEHVVLPCVQQYGYAVGPRGIFYTACEGEDAGASPRRHLRYWDAVTKRQRSVADVEAEVVMGLSVSPDGKHLLYGRLEARSDLMMIENFP